MPIRRDSFCPFPTLSGKDVAAARFLWLPKWGRVEPVSTRQFFPPLAKEYNPAFPEDTVKRWIALLIILLGFWGLTPASRAQNNAPSTGPVTVIRAGVLIDGVSATPRRNQVITIRGNVIAAVADAGTFATANLPAGSTFIDLSQATVLPGLIDVHTHIFLQGEDPAQGGYDIQLLKYPLAFRAVSGDGFGASRPRTRVHHFARSGDRRRRLWRRGHQNGD